MNEYKKNYDITNCMTVIVGKDASQTGRVLVAHNEDDSGILTIRRTLVPARDFSPGSVLPAEPGLAAVPQVPHTLSFYWIEYLSPTEGLSSSDSFYNECGVVITSNSMGWSKESSDDPSLVKNGGIGYNMRRILAERAHSAREGAEILMELMEKWGYAFSGRAYTIADKDEAFMFQLVRGHRYVGARVPDDGIVVMPNMYDFHTLRDVPEMYYAKDLIRRAEEMGWYKAKTEDCSDFDFASAYQKAGEKPIHDNNAYRYKHGRRLMHGRAWDLERDGTPFSVPAEAKVDAEDLWRVMTNHYEGTEDDAELCGPGRSPHDSVPRRRICCGTTQECDIYQLAENPADSCIYTSLGRPCQLPMLPLHPFRGLPKELICAEDPAEMLETHTAPRHSPMQRLPEPAQNFRDFGAAFEMLYKDVHPVLFPQLAELFRKAQEENAAVQKNPSEACALDSEFLKEALAWVEKTAEACFPTGVIRTVSPIEFGKTEGSISLTFDMEGEVEESELVFGPETTNIRTAFAAALPGSLKSEGKGRWTVLFPLEPISKELTAEGCYSFWLGGQTKDGRCFAASAAVSVQASGNNN